MRCACLGASASLSRSEAWMRVSDPATLLSPFVSPSPVREDPQSYPASCPPRIPRSDKAIKPCLRLTFFTLWSKLSSLLNELGLALLHERRDTLLGLLA